MNELESIFIEGARYEYDKDKEYIKDGHAYCKVCHEKKDFPPIKLGDSSMIFKRMCRCDREKEEKEKERDRIDRINQLKSICFMSSTQWKYRFDNYTGEMNTSLVVAKNYVKHFKQMMEDNIGLLFYGNVGSGKTFLACSIANAIIEEYEIGVKIRNFAEIINDISSGGFEFDKNRYIDQLVRTPLLILDDLGMERETSYAKEQVYNIVNARYLKQKPTIFTTNLSYEYMNNGGETLDDKRIYSRVMEMCIPVVVTGMDIRKQIQKKKIDINRKKLLEER